MSTEKLKEAIVLDYNEVEPCVTKVNVNIPLDTIKQEMNETVKEFINLAQVPGFRQGKAPASIIRNKFHSEIEGEIVKRFFMVGYEKISEEKKIDIVTYPANDEKPPALKVDEDYSFSMEFNTAPQFELPEYKGIKIEVAETEINEEEVTKQIDHYRNVYAEYKTVDSAAEAGDMLKVSYTSDFELAEDASLSLKRQVDTDENWLWLQDPEMIPGCIEALTGAEKDKEYEISAVYPGDFREADLAGKTVNYKINVIETQRKDPIQNDEALAQKMNLETIDQLKEQIQDRVENEAKHKQESEARQQLSDKVMEQVADFTLPPAILDNEKVRELRTIANNLVKSQEDADKFKEEQTTHEKAALETATKRLKSFFVFRKIAELEEISVDNTEIDNRIKGMSSMYGMKEKELKDLMEKNGGMEDLHVDLLMSKVSDLIHENADIKPAKKKAIKEDKSSEK